MKTKNSLVVALFPLLLLAGCDDSNEAKLKKQEESVKDIKNRLKKINPRDQQKARSFLFWQDADKIQLNFQRQQPQKSLNFDLES